MSSASFRAGDEVWVKSPEEILSTLDKDGALDGVPFMPEMLDWCGKSFRVQRLVEKSCGGGSTLRHFPTNDVVVLDGRRCDGQAHDGCGYGCRIFWKEAWLQSAKSEVPKPEITADGIRKLRTRLKIRSDEQHYFCQLTEVRNATEPFSGPRRFLTPRIALKEIGDGDLSAYKILTLYARWFLIRVLRAAGADRWANGHCKRTPDESLDLRPGDTVRIKSRARIAQTLNSHGRNRGLAIWYEMTRFCGRVAEVDRRIDRFIDNNTARMQKMSNTVTLKNIGGHESLAEECHCMYQLGDCPRGEPMFWRETWLERVSQRSGSSGAISSRRKRQA